MYTHILLLMTPMLLALSLLLDVYQADSVFEDRWDGPLVSCSLTGALFLGALGLGRIVWPDPAVAALLIAGGALEIATLFFYFSALHARNDAVVAESLNALTLLMVPLFGFLLFGTTLSAGTLPGLSLAIVCALLFALGNGTVVASLARRATALMFCSVLCAALAIVLLDAAYARTPFGSGFLVCCGGHLVAAAVLRTLRPRRVDGRPRAGLRRLWRRHWRLFLAVEALALAYMWTFQKALDLGDAALVTLANATAPMLLILLALAAIGARGHRAADRLAGLLEQQLGDVRLKLCAIGGTFTGLWLALAAGG